MGYTSLATVLHRRDLRDSTLEAAIDAANRWNAHLHVLCTGVNYVEPGFYYAGAQAIVVQENLEQAQEDAVALETEVRKRLARENLSWDVQAITVMPAGLDGFLADDLRFHDLIVLPAPYNEAPDTLDISIFESCLFGANRPVLVVPPGITEMRFDAVMVCWNDGEEALAAARAAVPVLQRADTTEITIIDPPTTAPDRSDAGGRLAQYLARHGTRPDINVISGSGDIPAKQLLRRAHERDIDLIVMGAYGHSRLREAILGGATRDMLQIADLPVLMAR
ncbi:universal stress protein [Aestuariibius insulae]|uniref:universal stress protein n=1 Tax=Aestuariibius insulae TaxID=2058287 RepID=UPI00345E7E86